MVIKRARIVVELGSGDGLTLRKFASRFKKSGLHFTGVDTASATPFEQSGAGSNFEFVKSDAAEFLSKAEQNSIHHAFSAFSLKHVPFKRRKSIFYHLFRALKPGRHLAIMEDSPYAAVFKEQLERAGFKVRVSELAGEELGKYPSKDTAERYGVAKILAEALKKYEASPEHVRKGALKGSREVGLRVLTRAIEKVEGSKPEKETLAAIKKVFSEAQKLYPLKMFRLVRAFKPIEKT